MNVIISGLGYGDEGKGVAVNFYAKTLHNPLVVRYGGGNQVGHTVHEKGIIHEFHHLGSGTLAGVPTYYSDFCTVDPIGVVDEMQYLKEFRPEVYYHPKCMIVTPADVSKNRKLHQENAHGTVGLGFGTTLQRNEDHYHLYVDDIRCKRIFIEKVRALYRYYHPEVDQDYHHNDFLEFYERCEEFLYRVKIFPLDFIKRYKNVIYEGHQGVLLDKEYGVFPHVTRSKTTCYNALQLLARLGTYSFTIIGVTRAYSTRHGNGPFEEAPIILVNTEHEANRDNEYQGRFKKSPLQLDLLEYAYRKNCQDAGREGSILITCLDQVENPKQVIEEIRKICPNLYGNGSTKSNVYALF